MEMFGLAWVNHWSSRMCSRADHTCCVFSFTTLLLESVVPTSLLVVRPHGRRSNLGRLCPRWSSTTTERALLTIALDCFNDHRWSNGFHLVCVNHIPLRSLVPPRSMAAFIGTASDFCALKRYRCCCWPVICAIPLGNSFLSTDCLLQQQKGHR